MQLEIVLTRKQFRNFDFQLYPDCHLYHYPNGVGCDAYNLIKFLEINSGAVEYAWILHDKDFLDSGVEEKPHYHVVLIFHAYHRIQELSNRYGIPLNNFSLFEAKDKHGNTLKDADGSPKYSEPNRKKRFEYLCHGDDPRNSGKTQYREDMVHTNVQNFVWRPIDYENRHINEDALIDYCSTHSVQESLEWARLHDMRSEFYRYRSLINDLRHENEDLIARRQMSLARSVREAANVINFNARAYAEKALRDAIKQPSEFYDSEGNLLGIGF